MQPKILFIYWIKRPWNEVGLRQLAFIWSYPNTKLFSSMLALTTSFARSLSQPQVAASRNSTPSCKACFGFLFKLEIFLQHAAHHLRGARAWQQHHGMIWLACKDHSCGNYYLLYSHNHEWELWKREVARGALCTMAKWQSEVSRRPTGIGAVIGRLRTSRISRSYFGHLHYNMNDYQLKSESRKGAYWSADHFSTSPKRLSISAPPKMFGCGCPAQGWRSHLLLGSTRCNSKTAMVGE